MAVGKAVSSETQFMRDAARQSLAGNPGSTADLEAALRGIFVDAYGTGAHAAGQQLPPGSATLPGVDGTSWDSWQPGDTAAADLASNGGLANMLDDAGIGIKGITGSLLDQLGNRIGDGLASGDSVDSVARGLMDIVGDRSRAEMIAHTETARAATIATLDTYGANGVGEWDWVLSDGACPECEDQEADNPHPLADSGDQPPLHPRCRCAVSPVVESITATGEAGGVDDAAMQEALGVAADMLEPEAVDLASMSDDALAEHLATVAEDPEQLDQVLAELDRREADAKAIAEGANPEDLAKEREYDRLLDAGTDPEQAFEQVYGSTTSTDQPRRDVAIAGLRSAGYKGKGLDELLQAQFKEYADTSYLEAEAQSNGFLLNEAGRKAGIDPGSLFTGPESRARKYASDELRSYWQSKGRLTVDDFKAAALGGKGRASGAEYWL
jgi:hypothetical protein